MMETSLSPQAASLDVQVSFGMQHLNMNFSRIHLKRWILLFLWDFCERYSFHNVELDIVVQRSSRNFFSILFPPT